MDYRESSGPGHHRISARTLDFWRNAPRHKTRVLSSEERAGFRRLNENRSKTPTELVYEEMLRKRKEQS